MIMESAAETAGRRLLDLLPEYYRESPERLGSILVVAEELLAVARAHLAQRQEQLDDGAILALKERLFPAAPERRATAPAAEPRAENAPGDGTRREFRRWFRARWGVAPRLWAGFEVRAAGAGRVVLRRARRPAVVVVWDRKSSTEPPRTLALPRTRIPLRTRLQVILPLSEEDVSVVCHGRALNAEILWDSHAAAGK